METFLVIDRPALLRRGLRLEYLTVGWNGQSTPASDPPSTSLR